MCEGIKAVLGPSCFLSPVPDGAETWWRANRREEMEAAQHHVPLRELVLSGVASPSVHMHQQRDEHDRCPQGQQDGTYHCPSLRHGAPMSPIDDDRDQHPDQELWRRHRDGLSNPVAPLEVQDPKGEAARVLEVVNGRQDRQKGQSPKGRER